VLALFWLLIAVLLELNALGPLFIFFYALLGAAGAGELNREYDFADDFVAEDYCHTCFSKENQVQTYMHDRFKFHAYS
jgi:hypothetical protein